MSDAKAPQTITLVSNDGVPITVGKSSPTPPPIQHSIATDFKQSARSQNDPCSS
jgi:hypothetical protein